MARILIIEDEELVRFSLADTILLAGHEVLEARNGQEGLKVLDEEPVEIVITDIIMPVMEGVQTTIEIRRSHPTLKIIAISGGGRAKKHAVSQPGKTLWRRFHPQKALLERGVDPSNQQMH